MLDGRRVPVFLSGWLLSVWRLAVLDVRGRLRAPGALLSLGLMVALAALYLPEHAAPYVTLSVNGARGLYDSAWVGVTVALLGTFAFPLVGFMLVRASLEAERKWRVEHWTRTTPLSAFGQVLGKTCGQFAFLALLAGAVALTAPWIQWIRGEDRTLDWAALLLPSALLTLPTLFLVAALAVSFARFPRLRGGLGTGLFLLLWSLAALAALQTSRFPDPLGAAPVLGQLLSDTGNRAGQAALTLGLTPAISPPRFDWNGVSWTLENVLGRGLWLLGGLLLLAAVARLRQGPPEGVMPEARPSASARQHLSRRLLQPFGAAQAPVWGELRAALHSLHPATGLLLAVLSVAGIAAPDALLPLILLALLPVFSALTGAPYRFGLAPLLATLPRGAGNLFGIQWLALATLTLLCTGPALLVSAGRGEVGAAWGLLVLPMFVPMLALSAATLTRGSTLFEALFVAFWYLGPVSGWAGLDYTQPRVALAALTLSLVLACITWIRSTAPQGGST